MIVQYKAKFISSHLSRKMAASIKNVNALFKIAVNRILMSWGSLQVSTKLYVFGYFDSLQKLIHLTCTVTVYFEHNGHVVMMSGDYIMIIFKCYFSEST